MRQLLVERAGYQHRRPTSDKGEKTSDVQPQVRGCAKRARQNSSGQRRVHVRKMSLNLREGGISRRRRQLPLCVCVSTQHDKRLPNENMSTSLLTVLTFSLVSRRERRRLVGTTPTY